MRAFVYEFVTASGIGRAPDDRDRSLYTEGRAMRDALAEGRAGEGWADGKGRFLIDGFPRKMDQALKFEEDVRFFYTFLRVCVFGEADWGSV